MGPIVRACGNRRGSVMVIFAACLAVCPVIAITLLEMGSLVTAQMEVQRAVDAGALAGASAFVDDSGLGPQPAADARARHYVGRNPVRGRAVTAESVEVDLAAHTVTVRAEVQVPVMLLPGTRVAARAVAAEVNDSLRLVR